MGMGHDRPARVASEFARELGLVLARGGLKDPRITGLVTVTGAKMAPDLKDITVYLSILGDEPVKKSTLEGLRAAATYLQARGGRQPQAPPHAPPAHRLRRVGGARRPDRPAPAPKPAPAAPLQAARARSRRLRTHGILLVDKPAGPTSHDVVFRIGAPSGPATPATPARWTRPPPASWPSVSATP